MEKFEGTPVTITEKVIYTGDDDWKPDPVLYIRYFLLEPENRTLWKILKA